MLFGNRAELIFNQGQLNIKGNVYDICNPTVEYLI